jgi:hypothetical protein
VAGAPAEGVAGALADGVGSPLGVGLALGVGLVLGVGVPVGVPDGVVVDADGLGLPGAVARPPGAPGADVR